MYIVPWQSKDHVEDSDLIIVWQVLVFVSVVTFPVSKPFSGQSILGGEKPFHSKSPKKRQNATKGKKTNNVENLNSDEPCVRIAVSVGACNASARTSTVCLPTLGRLPSECSFFESGIGLAMKKN
eukprot:589965-Amphidinium_carterae.1